MNDLAALWYAAAVELPGTKPGSVRKLANAERDLVRLLIALPCRLREATRLEWQHLSLDSATWRLAGAVTKNAEPFELHIHSLALSLLRARHEAAGKPKAGLVFPASRSGKDIKAFTHIKTHITEAASVSGFSFHDCRRAFASICAEALGVAESVADGILNHKQSATRGGVLGVYQTARRQPERVAALNAWGEALTLAISSKDCSESRDGACVAICGEPITSTQEAGAPMLKVLNR